MTDLASVKKLREWLDYKKGKNHMSGDKRTKPQFGDEITLAIIDWLREHDSGALIDKIGCGHYSSCTFCRFAKYIGYGSSCLDTWKALGKYIDNER